MGRCGAGELGTATSTLPLAGYDTGIATPSASRGARQTHRIVAYTSRLLLPNALTMALHIGGADHPSPLISSVAGWPRLCR